MSTIFCKSGVMSRKKAFKNYKPESTKSGQMDIELRRSTCDPSIGIEYFIVDDERFQDKFEDQRYEEIIYVRGRNREETIYCVLNELWKLNDKRPVYVVKSLESWDKLRDLGYSGNVYIPWFYADEIVAIENNTNIFVIVFAKLWNGIQQSICPFSRYTWIVCPNQKKIVSW